MGDKIYSQNLGQFSLAQGQPAWIPAAGTVAAGGSGGGVASRLLSAGLGALTASNPISFGAAAAPALVQGAFGLLGGLLAPSQKKKWKWEREHLQKLTDQRLASIDKSMKPKTEYFNFAQGAPQASNLLNSLLGAKAGMYYGGAGAAPGWGGNNLSAAIQGMQAPQRSVTPATLPAWAQRV